MFRGSLAGLQRLASKEHLMSASSAAVATPKRKDPKPREVTGLALGANGESRFTKIVNKDPQKKYVLAWQADDVTGASYYESLGYDIELYRDGGPRLAAMRKAQPGEAMVFRGCVLMSISLEAYNELQKFGEEGNTGQAWADSIEKRIHKSKRVENPFAGANVGVDSNGKRYVAEDKSADPEDDQ
jgi:hypothetical protein